MKIIADWIKKGLKCSYCGTRKSVKYIDKNDVYCNKCILAHLKEGTKIRR